VVKKSFSFLPSHLLILSDIHTKYSLFPQFERERQKQLIDEINKRTREDTVVVLNGDILDKATPSLEEIEAFYYLVENLKASAIILVTGNHEILNNEHCTYDFLPSIDKLYYNDFFELENDFIKLNIVGYRSLNLIFDLVSDTKTNLLISHYRSELRFASEEVDNQKVSSLYAYAILGDIHEHYKPKDNIEYTSSPYSVSFSDIDDYGFIELAINGKEFDVQWHKLNLPCLKKVIFWSEEELFSYEFSDRYLYKIVTEFPANANVLDFVAKQSAIVKASYAKPEIEEIEEKELENFSASTENIIELLHSLVKDKSELDEEVCNKGLAILKGFL